MSDPRDQDDLPFERSSIAAMGARRKRGLFGLFSNGAEASEPDAEPGFESGPLHPGMLQSLA